MTRVMDVTDMSFPEDRFDTVLMIGANLGIVGDSTQIQGVLSSLDRVTKPDAIIIGSTRAPLKTENPAHLSYQETNRRRGKSPGLVRIRVNFREGEWFEFLMMGEELLAEILEPTNWKTSKIYDSGNSDYIAILSKKRRR